MSDVPLVIVGAGPAGLAAAHAYRQHGSEFLLFDAGANVDARSRTDPRDVINGVGGAGLYSDGKFSFFPSASGLWSLGDAALLRDSYAWVRGLLGGFGLQAPAFPERPAPEPEPSGFKPYPSMTLDLEARVSLIKSLHAPIAEHVELHTRLLGVAADRRGFELRVRGPSGVRTVRTRQLIGAGGRFFPLLLQTQRVIPTRFRRVELGVRIEGPAEHTFFQALRRAGRSLDPKLIVSPPGSDLEWRTFCFCAQGEVVRSRDYGLESFSGRSDCPPSGRSNVGFNLRLRRPGETTALLERLRQHGPFRHAFSEILGGPAALKPAFGPELASAFHRGLLELGARLPLEGGRGLSVLGPTIEGVGDYPVTDAHLKCPSLPLHVAGDSGGRFRGLVPALVSGAYVGARVGRAALEHDLRPAAT